MRCHTGTAVREQFEAAGAYPMMGAHLPWMLLPESQFNSDPKRRTEWLQLAATEARAKATSSSSSGRGGSAKKTKSRSARAAKQVESATALKTGSTARTKRGRAGRAVVKEEEEEEEEEEEAAAAAAAAASPKKRARRQAKKLDVPAEVRKYIASVTPAWRQADCETLLELLGRVSGCRPRMSGSMVGFGSYHYKYKTGREGDCYQTGFAARKAAFTIAVLPGLAGYSSSTLPL